MTDNYNGQLCKTFHPRKHEALRKHSLRLPAGACAARSPVPQLPGYLQPPKLDTERCAGPGQRPAGQGQPPEYLPSLAGGFYSPQHAPGCWGSALQPHPSRLFKNRAETHAAAGRWTKHLAGRASAPLVRLTQADFPNCEPHGTSQ